jgi:cell division transport system permease protein
VFCLRFNSVKYFIKEGGKSFWSNISMSLACVVIVAACLIFFGIYMVFTANVDYLGAKLENDYQADVFLSKEITDRDIEDIGVRMNRLDNVAKVEYYSKDSRLADFNAKTDGAAAGYEHDNPLNNSYKVSFANLEQADSTIQQIMDIPGVQSTTSSKDKIDKIVATTRGIKYGVLILMTLLIAISIFIISNTIKMTVFDRRKDINIMKFVGATDWFIRWPFIIEGIVIGLVGSLLAFLVVWQGYSMATNSISKFMSNFNIFEALKTANQMAPILLVCLVGFGVVIGSLGSAISVRKHLKV